MYLCAGFPSWFSDVHLSSFQLLMLGGTLLVVAGLLLGLRRSTRMTLQRSLLTDEVIAYLGRISDALERNTPPSKEEIIAEVERRMAERAEAKLGVKAHTIPYSMFGREYSENK